MSVTNLTEILATDPGMETDITNKQTLSEPPNPIPPHPVPLPSQTTTPTPSPLLPSLLDIEIPHYSKNDIGMNQMDVDLGAHKKNFSSITKQIPEERANMPSAQYVTLQPYEGVSRRKRKYKPVYDGGSATTNNDSFAKHYLISCKEGDFRNRCPIQLCKLIRQIIGPAVCIRKNWAGKLHVECSNPDQANKLMQMSVLGDTPITVTSNKALNTSKGVVTCRDLVHSDEKEILEELRDQGVEEVRRIQRKDNGILKNTASLVLTFSRPQPPLSVSVAYYKLKVRPYVPAPMRCFQCLRVGHTANRCNIAVKMCNCGDPIGNDPEQHVCRDPPKCVNCGAAHSARSNECPILQEEKHVQKIKVEKQITYNEARNFVRNNEHIKENGTYSNAATSQRKVKQEMSTQTCSTDVPFFFQATKHQEITNNIQESASPLISTVVEATIANLLATLERCYGIKVAIPADPKAINQCQPGSLIAGIGPSAQASQEENRAKATVTSTPNSSRMSTRSSSLLSNQGATLQGVGGKLGKNPSPLNSGAGPPKLTGGTKPTSPSDKPRSQRENKRGPGRQVGNNVSNLPESSKRGSAPPSRGSR